MRDHSFVKSIVSTLDAIERDVISRMCSRIASVGVSCVGVLTRCCAALLRSRCLRAVCISVDVITPAIILYNMNKPITNK